MTEQLIKDFIKKFPISGEQKETPYIILFDAFTGMGKSTVSKKIQELEHSTILNNDEVRNWLNDYND